MIHPHIRQESRKWPHRSNQCSTASGNSCVARAACLGTVTQSRRPQPIVTRPGTVPAGAPCCLGPLVRASMAASVAGASASPDTSGSTVSRESGQGRADNCANSTVLPAGLASSDGNLPRSARTSVIDGRSVAPKTKSSRSLQIRLGPRPRCRRRLPAARARAPCGRPSIGRQWDPSSPCSRMKSATESVRVAIETSPVRGGVSPNPGRSTAITSRRSASCSMIGFQDRQPAPKPCTSNSGLPLPRLTWFDVTPGRYPTRNSVQVRSPQADPP